jgi:hypothetical protein
MAKHDPVKARMIGKRSQLHEPEPVAIESDHLVEAIRWSRDAQMKAKERLGEGSANCPGLRRSIRDPSARPKPCRALRNFDQCPIEEAAQARQFALPFSIAPFPRLLFI